MAKGLMLAMMEPPASMAEEFNDWYDTEHFPERNGCKGFLAAQRYVCLQGWPRYLAFYDLETTAVLDSPDYRAFTGPNLGPWSRRILARMLGEYRGVGTLIYPDDAISLPKAERAYLSLVRFVGVRKGGEARIVDGLRQRTAAMGEVRQLRVYRLEGTRGRECLAVLESSRPLMDLELSGLGRAAGTVRFANTYAAYWRKGLNE